MFPKTFHFKAKLMLYYALVILTIFTVVGVLVYQYNAGTLIIGAKNLLMQNTRHIALQLEYTFRDMGSVIDTINGDDEIVGLMPHVNTQTWSRVTAENKMLDFPQMRAKFLSVVPNLDEVYRVSLLNVNGDMLSSRAVEADKLEIINAIDKIERFSNLPTVGGCLFWGPHYDPWMSKQHIQVFSMIRPVVRQGVEIGWIEVQQKVTKLQQISSLRGNNRIDIIMLGQDGAVIYSTWKLLNKTLLNHYNNTCMNSQGVIVAGNPISKLNEIIAYTASDSFGFRVAAIQSERDVENSLRGLQIIVVAAFLMVLALSIASFNFFAERLTMPLQLFMAQMEQVDIGLPAHTLAEIRPTGVSEIDALQVSFRKMIVRLDSSVQNEVASRSLQLQARLDALQARINPHFMFNMLGVMALAAEEKEDEEVAKMCRRLAQFIRYTTKSSKVTATMRQEISHCKDYMFLMEKRFEDRIKFEVDVDESLMDIQLPQLTFQPLIENSIIHGYKNTMRYVMHIRILSESDGERWRVMVVDDGDGFTDDTLERIRGDIASYTANLLESSSADDVNIGGMGLINTFARLALFSGDRIKCGIANGDAGGACITIEGILTVTREGKNAL